MVSQDAFEKRFRAAVRTRKVSPQLQPLLRDVYFAFDRDARSVRTALEELLAFLSLPAGRTDANCCATDFFFSALDDDPRTGSLPPALRSIVDDMGGALHDTVYAPHIASNFGSLPEQLLQRLRDLAPD